MGLRCNVCVRSFLTYNGTPRLECDSSLDCWCFGWVLYWSLVFVRGHFELIEDGMHVYSCVECKEYLFSDYGRLWNQPDLLLVTIGSSSFVLVISNQLKLLEMNVPHFLLWFDVKPGKVLALSHCMAAFSKCQGKTKELRCSAAFAFLDRRLPVALPFWSCKTLVENGVKFSTSRQKSFPVAPDL